MPSLQTRADAIASHYLNGADRLPKNHVLPLRPTFQRLGRPRTLTEDLANEIAELIVTKGGYIDDACLECDVPRATFYHWQQLGKRDRQSGQETVATYFLDTLEKADAMVRNSIAEAALTGDAKWVPRMTLGQRKYPDKFGVRQDDTQAVKVHVEIGRIENSDVRVGIALSPSTPSGSVLSSQDRAQTFALANSLETHAFAESSSPITAIMMTPSPGSDAVSAREIPAVESAGGPYPVGQEPSACVGGVADQSVSLPAGAGRRKKRLSGRIASRAGASTKRRLRRGGQSRPSAGGSDGV